MATGWRGMHTLGVMGLLATTVFGGTASAGEQAGEPAWGVEGAPTSTGVSGLNRVPTATGIDAGQVAFGVHGSFFRGSDAVRRGDETRRNTGSFTLSIRPLEELEVFASLSSRAVRNSFANPELMQSTGNLGLGSRGGVEVFDGLHVGGMLAFDFPAGAESVGIAFDSSTITLLAMGTADLRTLVDETVPVRAHLATGPVIDNTRNLFAQELTRPERFGQDVTAYSRWRLGLGVDAPLPWVTPYVEWVLDIPINPPCSNTLTVRCVGDSGFAAFPSFVTLGARGTPMVEGLVLHTGVELGMTTNESQGTPAIPAWNWIFGASWAFDAIGPAASRERGAPTERASRGAELASVSGRVVDSHTGESLAGVRVRWADQSWSDQVVDDAGRFLSAPVLVGTEAAIEFSREGYETRTERFRVPAEGLALDIAMDEAIEGARFAGTVTLEQGTAEAARLHAVRPGEHEEIAVTADGHFEADLEPGTWLLYVTAPGHRTVRQRQPLEAGRQEAAFDLPLLEPGEPRLLPDRLLFDDPIDEVVFDGESLDPGSMDAIARIATLLDATRGLRLQVRTHTDDREDEEEERRLTEARAQAVLDALLAAGVQEGRVTSEAVGAAEPLVPNLNERNRARNNRVEFVVIGP